MEIDPKVIQSATKCPSNFSCLSNQNHALCIVKECVNEKIYFLECPKDNLCNYKISFGKFDTCSCPVRQEIYNQFKV